MRKMRSCLFYSCVNLQRLLCVYGGQLDRVFRAGNMDTATENERRQSPRYALRTDVFLAFRPDFTTLGKLEDISNGGVALEYAVFEKYEEVVDVEVPARHGSTEKQLIDELESLRQRVAELENDMADRRVVEEALKDSEERFRVIFDNLRDGLLLAGKETKKFLMGNPAIHQMFGYSSEELKHLGLTDIHPEQGRSAFTVKTYAEETDGISRARDLEPLTTWLSP
jgi:PAS domain-containing protein